MSALLLTAVALPLAGAAWRRASAPAAGLAFGLAIAVLVAAATGGRVSAVLEHGSGDALAGLTADRVSGVLLLLVLGVSAVVQAFAGRYLRGDVRAPAFFAAAAVLTSATAAMVTAATLVGLALAWTLSGLALHRLLSLYRGLPAADEGARRARRAFAAGDLALWAAVGVALGAWGDLDLRTLAADAPALAADGAALAAFALLLVLAAAARSAQLPLQSWLPATLAAPTPVSALLHAGVVNAGGVLLVRLSPLFGASAAATHLAFAVGAATALYGTALMLAKADVKGALAHSTMGQMGFMIMTCGLGAFAAAIFHLVAHGMYKATLFLGSGSAVGRHVRARKAPPATGGLGTAPAAVAAAILPAAALAGAAMLLHPRLGGADGSAALLVFAWASAAWATFGWLRLQRSARALAPAAAAVAGAAVAYVGVLAAVTGFLAPALAGAGTATVSPWALAAVAAPMLVLAAAPRLHRTLYVRVLAAADPARRPRARVHLPRPQVALPALALPAGADRGRS